MICRASQVSPMSCVILVVSLRRCVVVMWSPDSRFYSLSHVDVDNIGSALEMPGTQLWFPSIGKERKGTKNSVISIDVLILRGQNSSR